MQSTKFKISDPLNLCAGSVDGLAEALGETEFVGVALLLGEAEGLSAAITIVALSAFIFLLTGFPDKETLLVIVAVIPRRLS